MSTRHYTAEAVFPGHPDKLCDAVADHIVQQAVAKHPHASCGVEVAAYQKTLVVTGELATPETGDISVITAVRDVWASAGYGKHWGPEGDALNVLDSLKREPLCELTAACPWLANDQCVVTGYAVDIPETNYLPVEQWLVHRLSRRLESIRIEKPNLCLGPDGKVQIVVKDYGPELGLSSVNLSVQQSASGSNIDLAREVRTALREELETLAGEYPLLRPEVPGELRVNGSSSFTVGGTYGDNGLSGKKLVVDFYGPRVPIGGGALSGKDLFKSDRGGALLARRLAKAVVMTGAARECTATLAVYPVGECFEVVSLRDQDGRELDAKRWTRLVDLRLEALDAYVRSDLDWVGLARYGHFTDAQLPWERISI